MLFIFNELFYIELTLNNVWLPKEFWDELNYCRP